MYHDTIIISEANHLINKIMKAWQDGDDEIYTVEKSNDTLYGIIFILIILGFIIGEIIMRSI